MSIVHGLTLDQRLLLAAASSWCATTMYARATSGDAFFGASSGRLRHGDHITQPSWLTDGGYRYEGRALISPSLRVVAGPSGEGHQRRADHVCARGTRNRGG